MGSGLVGNAFVGSLAIPAIPKYSITLKKFGMIEDKAERKLF